MRVVFCSSYGYWGNLNYTDLYEKQIGGGETAMMNCAREWAAHGHEVFMFVPCEPGKQCGVDLLPVEMYVDFVTGVDTDAIIAWDHPHAFRFADRASAHILAF